MSRRIAQWWVTIRAQPVRCRGPAGGSGIAHSAYDPSPDYSDLSSQRRLFRSGM
jgi:hypothetical protein